MPVCVLGGCDCYVGQAGISREVGPEDVKRWREAQAEGLVFVFEHLLPALGTFLVVHCDAATLPDACVSSLRAVYRGVAEWARHFTTNT